MAGIGICYVESGYTVFSSTLKLYFRFMSSCGKQGWVLGVCQGRWQPCSSLQEGAKESTPNSPGLRGKTVSAVRPAGGWQ